jgi:hypothetical protein
MRAPALMRPDVLPAPPVPDMTIYRVCECVAWNTAWDLEAHHVGRRRTRKVPSHTAIERALTIECSSSSKRCSINSILTVLTRAVTMTMRLLEGHLRTEPAGARKNVCTEGRTVVGARRHRYCYGLTTYKASSDVRPRRKSVSKRETIQLGGSFA